VFLRRFHPVVVKKNSCTSRGTCEKNFWIEATWSCRYRWIRASQSKPRKLGARIKLGQLEIKNRTQTRVGHDKEATSPLIYLKRLLRKHLTSLYLSCWFSSVLLRTKTTFHVYLMFNLMPGFCLVILLLISAGEISLLWDWLHVSVETIAKDIFRTLHTNSQK